MHQEIQEIEDVTLFGTVIYPNIPGIDGLNGQGQTVAFGGTGYGASLQKDLPKSSSSGK